MWKSLYWRSAKPCARSSSSWSSVINSSSSETHLLMSFAQLFSVIFTLRLELLLCNEGLIVCGVGDVSVESSRVEKLDDSPAGGFVTEKIDALEFMFFTPPDAAPPEIPGAPPLAAVADSREDVGGCHPVTRFSLIEPLLLPDVVPCDADPLCPAMPRLPDTPVMLRLLLVVEFAAWDPDTRFGCDRCRSSSSCSICPKAKVVPCSMAVATTLSPLPPPEMAPGTRPPLLL